MKAHGLNTANGVRDVGEKIALTSGLRWTLTVASGMAVANIYYNQPMLADIGRDFHAGPHETGLIATFTQVRYAMGMPLFIPLGDYVNRRALVVFLFAAVACALDTEALATILIWLVAASFFIGVTTVIAQILIPLATELALSAEEVRTIGTILTGVLLGVLLARTVCGVVAQHFGLAHGVLGGRGRSVRVRCDPVAKAPGHEAAFVTDLLATISLLLLLRKAVDAIEVDAGGRVTEAAAGVSRSGDVFSRPSAPFGLRWFFYCRPHLITMARRRRGCLG